MAQADHPKLAGLHLPDSVVLEVITDDEALALEMEFCLTADHPAYVPPAPGEECCYRQGFMRFSDIEELQIDKTPENTSDDPDYGVFHSMQIDGDEYRISCGWGEITVTAGSFRVALDN